MGDCDFVVSGVKLLGWEENTQPEDVVAKITVENQKPEDGAVVVGAVVVLDGVVVVEYIEGKGTMVVAVRYFVNIKLLKLHLLHMYL